MRLAITGSNGFIGHTLSRVLKNHFSEIRRLVRSERNNSLDTFSIGNISSETNWTKALEGIDCVIHCAGIAHNKPKLNNQNISSYEEVNVQGTINLAEQAVKSGVKKLIFLSSLKVNGDINQESKPFTEKNIPNPKGKYALSKWLAEKSLREVESTSDLDLIILRLPLVYGPGVKANFFNLVRAVSMGVPMPLGSLDNKRSFISVDNLADILIACIKEQDARGKTFLVSDDSDISTSQLIESIAGLMNKPSRLFYVPKNILYLGGLLSNKQDMVRSLVDSLQVDISYTKKILKWQPQYSFEDGLKKVIDSAL